MTKPSISAQDAKEQLSELINRVSHYKEHIIITRRGKAIAALIPIEDLSLLEESQQKTDLQKAVESLKQARIEGDGGITLQQLKMENGTAVETPYAIKIAPKAHQYILHTSDHDKKTIIKLIETLAINPRPPGAQKIEGMTGLYVQALQNLRLIYKVDESEILILLVQGGGGPHPCPLPHKWGRGSL